MAGLLRITDRTTVCSPGRCVGHSPDPASLTGPLVHGTPSDGNRDKSVGSRTGM